ncbi:MAG: hypothetical protein VX768_01235 [Planctomycetota bacterium]|nr:hypothetical protein [Planctomycetota bacterium]
MPTAPKSVSPAKSLCHWIQPSGCTTVSRWTQCGILLAAFWLNGVWISSIALAQNSTKIKRVEPNPVSRRIGSAVQWSKSLKVALAESGKTGKPVFWYISTVPGTFMDRKVEIDRYMLGGPFSWPPLIEILNKHFIPLRSVPGRQEIPLGVRPFQFVEPGFLILTSDRKVIQKVDRLTTLHYGWLQKLLQDHLARQGTQVRIKKAPGYFERFSRTESEWVDPVGDGFERNAENLLLSGMIAFRRGDHELARKRWEEAAKVEPDHPLAWKASLESQGLGPFYRGFEVFRSLPDQALQAGLESVGSAAPPAVYDKNKLLQRSIDFLLGMQRMDGGFVDSDYDFGGTDSLPNVYVAVTSLAGMALIKAHRQLPDQRKRLSAAIQRAEKFVTNESNLNRADRDEILWACAYRLRFLSRLSRVPELAAQVEGLKEKQRLAVESLESIQLKTGNWYHEYNNPFVTATALCALHEAHEAGLTLDRKKIDRGLESLLRDRASNGTYPYYSERRKKQRNPAEEKRMLASSAGRMPVCELALVRWGAKQQSDLVAAVENSLEQHRHLASGYKYDNHTSNMAYGGFFFWYDMRGRSEAIRAILGPKREMLAEQQQKIIAGLPELDGCFVDSHELGRCYGTAMALLSMD